MLEEGRRKIFDFKFLKYLVVNGVKGSVSFMFVIWFKLCGLNVGLWDYVESRKMNFDVFEVLFVW